VTTTQRIEAFNRGRDPERLRLKLDIMRQDAFSFLRGTCHLFYEDLDYRALPDAPLVWCCGDLHLQNFGSYKGDDRLTYFDINDFDESCLAPATWDLVRFLASVIVAARGIRLSASTIEDLLTTFLAGYTSALQEGKPGILERETSKGPIRDLLAKVKKRDRRKFLDERTTGQAGERRLKRGKRALDLMPGEREMLEAFASEFAKTQPRPHFFDLLDAARRIAGTGSLGLPRYVLLVEGRGDDGNFLLDLKFQPPSATIRAHPRPQPNFPSDAHRVAFAEAAVQAVEPALLTPVRMDNRWWLLRELMPTGDRLNIRDAHADIAEFTALVWTLGRIVAWGSLRSAGHEGSASREALTGFSRDPNWSAPLLQVARECAQRTEQQFADFRMES
jgi:uncharacterized protein (DUF2252 family)